MLIHFLIGCLMLFLTTVVHSMAMMVALGTHRIINAHPRLRRVHLGHSLPIAFLVIVMAMASVVDSLVWAVTYVWLGAIDSLGEAMYFSVVTFTTLGYGDVTLTEQWRLLSALEAVNGVIMFGWSTAVIVAGVQRSYFPPAPTVEGRP